MTTRITARWAFLPGGELGEDVALDVAGGVIRGVVRRGKSSGGADEECDLGDALLLPGLVNAHVHLELSGFPTLPRPRSFLSWAARLGLRRSRTPRRELAAAAGRAVEALLLGGVTCVGELSTLGAAQEAFEGRRREGRGLAGVWYREMIAPDPDRADDKLRRAAALVVREARATGLRPGLFPHAPYSVSARLFGEAARLAGARGWPLATHASECPEETELFVRGTGLLARVRRLAGGRPLPVKGLTPVEWLDRAGALGPRTALVHMTHATDADIALVASRGAAVVSCPRSASFFGEGPPDLRRFLGAGVPVGLGTDSPASGGSVSLLEEMRALAAVQPGLSPREILLMATEGGARALGLGGRSGVLAPSARADVAALRTAGAGDPLAAWLDEDARIELVMLNGRRVPQKPSRRG